MKKEDKKLTLNKITVAKLTTSVEVQNLRSFEGWPGTCNWTYKICTGI